LTNLFLLSFDQHLSILFFYLRAIDFAKVVCLKKKEVSSSVHNSPFLSEFSLLSEYFVDKHLSQFPYVVCQETFWGEENSSYHMFEFPKRTFFAGLLPTTVSSSFVSVQKVCFLFSKEVKEVDLPNCPRFLFECGATEV
jgi:hypothetical protein